MEQTTSRCKCYVYNTIVKTVVLYLMTSVEQYEPRAEYQERDQINNRQIKEIMKTTDTVAEVIRCGRVKRISEISV